MRVINAVLAFFCGGISHDAIPMHNERRAMLINYETRG